MRLCCAPVVGRTPCVERRFWDARLQLDVCRAILEDRALISAQFNRRTLLPQKAMLKLLVTDPDLVQDGQEGGVSCSR